MKTEDILETEKRIAYEDKLIEEFVGKDGFNVKNSEKKKPYLNIGKA